MGHYPQNKAHLLFINSSQSKTTKVLLFFFLSEFIWNGCKGRGRAGGLRCFPKHHSKTTSECPAAPAALGQPCGHPQRACQAAWGHGSTPQSPGGTSVYPPIGKCLQQLGWQRDWTPIGPGPRGTGQHVRVQIHVQVHG